MKNKIYFGDNLDILRRYIKDESIDLIYLDPPFNSKRAYNMPHGKDTQARAFEDTWNWTEETAKAYEEIITKSTDQGIIMAIKAFHDMFGNDSLMAYLTMMSIRLLEMHRVLKPTGSIYLHCDPTASHYLKIIMDRIFGVQNFRNEIVWHYFMGGKAKTFFARKHDIILYYTKSNEYLFNIQKHKRRLDFKPSLRDDSKDAKMGKDEFGYYSTVTMDDVWDIKGVFNMSKEYTKYPTQKPLTLLERIIKASSNPGDVVLDPFCGCATTLIAAHKLQRQWIGIDITYLSVGLLKQRLKKLYIDEGEEQDEFMVEGEPRTIEQVYNLIKERGRFRFQEWIIVRMNGKPTMTNSKKNFKSNPKKTRDKGVDGFYYFMDTGKVQEIVLSVKSGGIKPHDIRDLRGVIERRSSIGGLFITINKPTMEMRTEAASAGFFYVLGEQFPKIQIITVQEILDEKKINLPKPKKLND